MSTNMNKEELPYVAIHPVSSRSCRKKLHRYHHRINWKALARKFKVADLNTSLESCYCWELIAMLYVKVSCFRRMHPFTRLLRKCYPFHSKRSHTGSAPEMLLGLEQANEQCWFPGILIPVPIHIRPHAESVPEHFWDRLHCERGLGEQHATSAKVSKVENYNKETLAAFKVSLSCFQR